MEPFDERETISVPVDEAEHAASVLGAPVAALRVFGSDDYVRLDAGLEAFSIGGRRECDLSLPDPCVSGRHCELRRRRGRWVVHDLASKNGTFVNGNRIEVAELRAGALIGVGMTTLLAVGDVRRARRSAEERLCGNDPRFLAAMETARRGGRNGCNVLLLGESGTGKELFARLVHESSPRAKQPFVAVNCGGIPRDLVASELFGHERGAFTGAVAERDGVFVQADGGTLFLDEIGELPAEEQPNLLRVLETSIVRRVGGRGERRVDVRVVAATLGDERRLRLDLYHRLATIVVRLPALRARRGDVPLLVREFLAELEPTHGRRRVSERTLTRLARYPWPGNVRELRQAARRAVALGGERLEFEDFLPEDCEYRRRTPVPPPIAGRTLDEVTADAIRVALDRHGSIRKAAKALNVSKSTLADRVRRYGLKSPRAKKRR